MSFQGVLVPPVQFNYPARGRAFKIRQTSHILVWLPSVVAHLWHVDSHR